MSTTNFERFKQKLEASKAKKPSATSSWFKAEAGKRYQLRFLPLKNENLELPLTIYHHHALTFPDGHFESIACPKKHDLGDCPFCDLAWKTYRTFTKTEDVSYKEAFKKLVAKTHYLLIAYDTKEVDPANITEADLKIVRASSKTNMEQLEGKLEKGVDFVDFQEGRNVEYVKSKATAKGAFDTIVFDFGDKSVAFEGKNGKKVWDELVEKSPDLAPIVNPLSHDALMAKFVEFSSQPVVAHDEQERQTLVPSMASTPKKAPVVSADDDDDSIDLDALRKELD